VIYFLLSIITVQTLIIFSFVKFVLKHFALTIEEIEEDTIEQAKKDTDKTTQ